jgi:hypothetical protein
MSNFSIALILATFIWMTIGFFHHPGVGKRPPGGQQLALSVAATEKHTLCPLNGRVEENYRVFNGGTTGTDIVVSLQCGDTA